MFWCLAWLDGPSGQREGHKISSPRAVPRDWWTIYWHACGGCRTQPFTWCQIPRTTAGLGLTPSPFAKAGRLYMGPWGLWGCWNCSEPHAFHHHMRGLAKVRQALESWMKSMPVVSFNDGHYNLQLIKHYTAHNCGAQELPWFRHFHFNEMPAPLMLAAASPQDVDDRDEMVNILKKGSCYVPPHPKVGLLGHLQLPASQWVQLCQLSKDLWRACLPRRKIFLSLWICGRSGLAARSPATLCGLLLLTAWQEHLERGPWVGSWSTELCWAVLALGMQGHDLASRSAGTF